MSILFEISDGKVKLDTKAHIVTLWENSSDDMSYLTMLDDIFEENCVFVFPPKFTDFRWF